MRRLVLVLLIAAVALPAGRAAAAPPLEIGVQDDAALVWQPPQWPARPQAREHAYSAARAIRARVVKINMIWADVARRQPTGADAEAWNWSRYDAAIDEARSRGYVLQVTLTAPAPSWATANGKRGVVDPDARQFATFVRAAVTHYRGRVRRWAIWNEPNWPSWLSPQRRAAPMYRRLYQHGYRAVKSVDPHATVLFGELAPMGPPEAAISPLRFLRSVTCVDSRLRRKARCAPLRADGFAHHPYTLRWAPAFKGNTYDDVPLGGLPKLRATLRVLARKRLLATPSGRQLPLYLTEYGYHGDSPRLPEARRSRYAREAFDRMLAEPGVKQVIWYHLVAPGPGFPTRQWDTALLDHDGRARPTLRTLQRWIRSADARKLLRVRR